MTYIWLINKLITGFDDAFRAIERLSMYVFDLPVDVAIKQFKDMNEAFWRKRNQTLPNPLFPALLSKHSLKQTFDLSHLKANTIVVVVLKDVDFLTYIKRWR